MHIWLGDTYDYVRERSYTRIQERDQDDRNTKLTNIKQSKYASGQPTGNNYIGVARNYVMEMLEHVHVLVNVQ